MMCKKDKETVVKLIKSGKDSYADFIKMFDQIDIFLISEESQMPDAIIKRKLPKKPGPFTPDTRFELNEDGKDLLYDLERWEKTLGSANASAKYARYAFWATVATIVLTVLQLLLR